MATPTDRFKEQEAVRRRAVQIVIARFVTFVIAAGLMVAGSALLWGQGGALLTAGIVLFIAMNRKLAS